jgi:hypothetical protein
VAILEVREINMLDIFNLCNSSAATQPSWIIPAITGFLTGSAAIVASYVQGLNARDLEKLKIASNQSNTKRMLYSDLLGYRFILEESVERLYDSNIFLKAYEIKYNGALDEYPILDEADRIHLNLNIMSLLRMHQEYETARRDLANNKNNVIRKIGYIQTLFTNDQNLDQLIKQLYEGWSAESNIPKIPDNPTNDQIDSWSESAVNMITIFIKEHYITPLTNLLNYLDSEIKNETNGSTSAKIGAKPS